MQAQKNPFDQPSTNIMLLADSFKEATKILVDTYRVFYIPIKSYQSELSWQETIEKKIDILEANV